jgi:hypothetical protein
MGQQEDAEKWPDARLHVRHEKVQGEEGLEPSLW